jgi:hypothetical protein
MEQIQGEEIAKYVDRDFLNWEKGRAFPMVLQEMLTLQEESETETKSVKRTVVRHSREVSSSPLPTLLAKDELSLRKRRIAPEN